MPNTGRSKADKLKQDQDLVKKIKPKLRRFVIDRQVEQAAKITRDKQDQEKKLKQMESEFREIIHRAYQLSQIFFLRDRLWQEYPPALATPWMVKGALTRADQDEQALDIWGFARYLAKEYFGNYLSPATDETGYPNPLDEKELVWFWLKFNADLKLAIKADSERVKAGNAPVILADEAQPKEEPQLITKAKEGNG